jgi:ribosomal protein S12 methylthiotransferase
MKKINIITLGCSKNTADSESLAAQLAAGGLQPVFDSDSFDAETVVINTCGFINDAKEESVDTILRFAKAKENGEIKNLFVIGCLAERYKDDLKKEICEVDEFFGVNDLAKIVKTLGAVYRDELFGEQMLSTPKHFAYLKISEGCDRTCAFCAIPLIRGKHKSVPQELLLKQAQNLAKKGVKELILIAQDLSYYGIDLYGEQKLAELVEILSKIEKLKRIRLHYAFPANFPLKVLEIIKEKSNVCNYIDIPLQHISDPVLKKMRRGHTKESTLQLLENIRKAVPEITIRTTFLVGHPGETEEDFEELLDFVKEQKFDRLGIFTYSHEEDTFGAKNYKDTVFEEIKQLRAEKLMAIQQEISLEKNTQKIGKTFDVIIDSEDSDYFVGRTESDSPEVDNEVLIEKNVNLAVGEIYSVEIISAENFDLYGVLV